MSTVIKRGNKEIELHTGVVHSQQDRQSRCRDTPIARTQTATFVEVDQGGPCRKFLFTSLATILSAPARHFAMPAFYRGTVECIHKYSMMRRRIGFTPRKVLSCPSTVLSYIFFLSAYMCAVQHTDYLHFSAHRYAAINKLWNEGRFFNPQHYHFGGGLSSRSVDNAGQSMSHCRKTFLVNKSSPITPPAICRNDDGFHLFDQFIVGLPRLR